MEQDNSGYELWNERFQNIKKELFEIQKESNTFVYEVAQLNVWLFLGTVGAVGISDDWYRMWALGMTGVFFFYQFFLLKNLKLNHDGQMQRLANLTIDIDRVDVEMKRLGYAGDRYGGEKNRKKPKEINFFWGVMVPIILNLSFYMFILRSNVSVFLGAHKPLIS